jgi:general nucleoside transport system ATP-binding protein
MQVVGVSRSFGEVHALQEVDLEIRRGEVLAVLGENGAGKTTLMRILGGLDQPSSGQVLRNGEPYVVRSPREAVASSISLVHQHFALVPTMTAAEMILLFRSDSSRRCDRAEAARQLAELAAGIDFDIDLDRPVGEQSVGEQQRLELLRALDSDPDVLLLDEPTAVLTDEEATAMLDVARRLAHEQHRAVVLITHRLREVVAAADRVVVLRAGKVVSPVSAVGDRTPESLAAEMVGSEVPSVSRGTLERGEVALEISGLVADRLDGVDLVVHRREILGVAGVDGNGQEPLELAIAGLLQPTAGSLSVGGTDLVGLHPRERIDAGLAYLPSDRYARALVGDMRCDENLLLGRTPWRLRSAPKDALHRMTSWAVKGEPHHDAKSLSGGNAQKLVAAREFGDDTKVVLACQPTRGLDPGAAQQLRQRLIDFAGEGGAVLWISADLDELLDSVDRLVVAFDGRIIGPFGRPFDRTEIGLAMAGAT